MEQYPGQRLLLFSPPITNWREGAAIKHPAAIRVRNSKMENNLFRFWNQLCGRIRK